MPIKVLLSLLLLISITAAGQSKVTGKWKTIDDTSGEVRSIVEISERGGKLYGKVVQIFPKAGEDQDPVCNKCPEDDPRYKKKIIGMEIIRDMVKDDEEYSGGTILDPEPGKIYRCKLWLEGNDLMIRGYWGPFYRTQTWKIVP
jgi:uncharacterized protein (DUF2147 family)